jgi:two-component system LytT family sensor kinase
MARMKSATKKKLLKFYLWVGLADFLLGVFHTSSQYPDKYLFVVLNSLWSIVYVLPLTYLLYESAAPFLLKKRRSVIYNILIGIFFLFAFMMLFSYGAYVWRLLGIQIHIYTALKQ